MTLPTPSSPWPRRWIGLLPYGVALALALALEGVARSLYPEGSHVLGQRLGEYHGNAALVYLFLVLLARPLRLLVHRRALGLSAFGFSALHTLYAFEHVLGGSLEGIFFLRLERQIGTWVGVVALLLLLLLTLTSSAWAIRRLGVWWKRLHALVALATVLAALHTAYMGVHYGLTPPRATSLALLLALVGVLVYRRSRAGARAGEG